MVRKRDSQSDMTEIRGRCDKARVRGGRNSENRERIEMGENMGRKMKRVNIGLGKLDWELWIGNIG